jgi:hypothetical protein
MAVAQLADALEAYADGRAAWWQFGGGDGLVMRAWRAPRRPEDLHLWARAASAALVLEEPLLRYASTLGASVDGRRLHSNLCGLLALRANDQQSAAQFVGHAQSEFWAAQIRGAPRKDRTVTVPVALRFHADHGEIADFHLTRLRDAEPGLVEDIEIALVPFGPTALAVVRACVPPTGAFAWSFRSRRSSPVDTPLDGASCGGALRLGFRVLQTRLTYNPACLVLTDRDFEPIEGAAAKVRAALADTTIRRVLLGRASPDSEALWRQFGGAIQVETIASEDEGIAKCITGIDASGQPSEPDDPFYVEPEALTAARRMLRGEDGQRMLIVRGPKRSGKTSLLRRLESDAHRRGARFAAVNLDHLQGQAFEAADVFFREFTSLLVAALGGTPLTAAEWQSLDTNQMKCTRHLERQLDPSRSLTIVLDQADSLLESPVKGDFYKMLRTWYNDGSGNTLLGRRWRSCSFVLLISADPNRFITDTSPFNVGTHVNLEALRPADVATMLDAAGWPPDLAAPVHALTGGWPYLVRLALADLTTFGGREWSEERYLDVDGGPFAQWLSGLSTQVRRHRPHMEAYLRGMVEGRSVPDSIPLETELTRFRLIRLGILDDSRVDQYSCELYRRFFHGRFV